jgi:hypothetical protein
MMSICNLDLRSNLNPIQISAGFSNHLQLRGQSQRYSFTTYTLYTEAKIQKLVYSTTVGTYLYR